MEGGRKISAPREGGGPGGAVRRGYPGVAKMVVGEEEEQLVAALIEAGPGNDQRPADGAAGILIPIPRLHHIEPVVEEFVGVQRFFAPVIVIPPLNTLRPLLHGNFDLPPVSP